jgi:hypothetical protein
MLDPQYLEVGKKKAGAQKLRTPDHGMSVQIPHRPPFPSPAYIHFALLRPPIRDEEEEEALQENARIRPIHR